jgi:hypothetical protein
MPEYKVVSGKVTDLHTTASSPEEAAIQCVEMWSNHLENLGTEIVVIPEIGEGLYKYTLQTILQKVKDRPKVDWVPAALTAGRAWETERQRNIRTKSVIDQLKLLAGEAYVEHRDDRAAILRQAVDVLIKPID